MTLDSSARSTPLIALAALALAALPACDEKSRRDSRIMSALATSDLPRFSREMGDEDFEGSRIRIREGVVVTTGIGELTDNAVFQDDEDFETSLTAKLADDPDPILLEGGQDEPTSHVLRTYDVAKAAGKSAFYTAVRNPESGSPHVVPLSTLSACEPAPKAPSHRKNCEACAETMSPPGEIAPKTCGFATIAWVDGGVAVRIDEATSNACMPAPAPAPSEGRAASPMGAWTLLDAKTCPPSKANGIAELVRAIDAKVPLCTSAALAPMPDTPWGEVALAAAEIVSTLGFERVAVVPASNVGAIDCATAHVF